ncbi:LacI family DNA-binding transcriptional regulator [Acerihabitans sp. TG2]|uniref:LacI family DNA-binding transcriptional regulator n=1 Tax=Acerihabitans sp. TG2 TaxID=3096008 RepID=UPI002B22D2A0|nr:LacI family DNA-binding transcriptional regulator [Acerihabitans sp. TG2]MEA9392478.1 LacI family DNA-binding transcriptional regulator [Acerihabitans sp. TG2]
MKPKNATLDDVARRAGVSYQTVSRVLNQSAHVTDATRAKVADAIRALNYVPNRMAQQLAGKRGFTLGLVTISLGLHAPAQIASALKYYASQQGFNVLIALADGDAGGGLQRALDELQAQRVDGVMLNLPLDAQQAQQVAADNPRLPCLFLDVPPSVQVFHVIFNPNDGTRASVEHLYRQGHRSFGLLSGPLASVSARLRLESWQRTLQEYGLAPAICRQGDWSAQSGYHCTLEMTRNPDAFTALLVGNDQMALGALSALQQLRLDVPARISLIGYDDTRDSAFFLPSLTTVSQDFDCLGREAVNRLVAYINDGPRQGAQSLVLPTQLVIRGSTAKPGTGHENHLQLAERLQQIAAQLRR